MRKSASTEIELEEDRRCLELLDRSGQQASVAADAAVEAGVLLFEELAERGELPRFTQSLIQFIYVTNQPVAMGCILHEARSMARLEDTKVSPSSRNIIKEPKEGDRAVLGERGRVAHTIEDVGVWVTAVCGTYERPGFVSHPTSVTRDCSKCELELSRRSRRRQE